MRAGVDGVNLHVRAYAINAPFSLTRHGLTPRPLLYGLLMFERTLGSDARLVRLHMAHARSLNLSAWAVRVRGGILHVLVLDKSNRTVRVDLRLPATGPATVQRLLAPSASATTGETLDGQRLGPDGTWVGARAHRDDHAWRGRLRADDAPAERGARRRAARAAVAAGLATHTPRPRTSVRHRATAHSGTTILAEQPGRGRV